MSYQVGAGSLFAGFVVLYSGLSSIQYEGPPTHISAILRMLSNLIPCTYEFAGATTGNVALAHDALTLIWSANFLVGIMHFAYLDQTVSVYRHLPKLEQSPRFSNGRVRNLFWKVWAMMLAVGVIAFAGGSPEPVLTGPPGAMGMSLLGLALQAAAAAVPIFAICQMIAMWRARREF